MMDAEFESKERGKHQHVEKTAFFISPSDGTKPAGSLFHYTDLNAVLSILKHNELWLTGYQFLNDEEEMANGISLSLVAAEQCHGPSYRDEDRAMVVNCLNNLCGDRKNPIEYIASFSEEGDLLSQWRAYGTFSIEFEPTLFPSIRCLYEAESKANFVQSAISKCIKRCQNTTYREDRNRLEGSLFVELSTLCLRMKNEGFLEEKEHRLIVAVHGDEGGKEILFRAKDDVVVPYITWGIEPKAIKAIHIGPVKNKALSRQSIEHMLRYLSAVNAGLYDHIQVKESNIPYRG